MPEELNIDEAAGNVIDDQPAKEGDAEPGDKEPLGDETPEPEPEVTDNGGEEVDDPAEIDESEQARRENQAAKDLRYELAKVRAELAELKGGKEPEAEEVVPQGIKEWYDTRANAKEQKLIRQVDAGAITLEEAKEAFADFKLDLEDQKQLREDNYRIVQSMEAQRGESNLATVKRTLLARGVKPGSLLEREVFRALKEDSGLDIKNPGLFATLKDAAKAAKITVAYVKEEVSERQAKVKPSKAPQKSPLDKVRLNDGSPSVGREPKKELSWDETCAALAEGKLP